MASPVIVGNHNTTILMNLLKNSKTQYPTLSKKQEQDLIEEYKNDREQLNKRLIMHNVKLVFNMAKKYMSKTNDYDGLVQDGMQGLAEAANRFDLDKNIKFSTYAFIWIKKYMTMNFYGKQIEIDKRSTSLNMPNISASAKSNNGNEVTLENYVNEYIDLSCQILKTTSHDLSANEQLDICKNLMKNLEADNSLSATDKAIFVDMFYNKEKPRELAEKYKVTMQEIAHLKSAILGKFKNILTKTYHINNYSDIAY